MGHLYLKPGRNVWNMKYYVHGKAVYESARTTIKSEAKKILQQREGDVADGKTIVKPHKLLVEDALKAVIYDYENNSRKSLTNLHYRINLHLKVLNNRRMSDLRSDDIKAYVDGRRAQGAAAATINRELAILKRAFTLAIREGRLLVKPHIAMLKERNVRSGFFEREELEVLCRHLPEALRPVMRFAYYTGWRVRAEILPLTWDRVDDEAIYLAPNTTKNEEGRAFPYASVPALKELMAQRKKAKVNEYVFHDGTGRRLTNWYAETWRDACEKASIAGKIPHDFRRTAVRNLVRAGVSEKTAMMLTGHKTRSVFDRYDITNLNDLKLGAGKLR